jgi:hypothetical protein
MPDLQSTLRYQARRDILMNRSITRCIFTLLLFTTCAIAQQPSDNTWARYKPGKLSSIIQAHSSNADSRDEGVNLGSDPVRARVTYTGRSRPTSVINQRFIAFYMESFGTPDFAKKFGTEMLFIEDGVAFWLPVQDVLIPYFRKELRQGESVTLLANWIGITYPERGRSGSHVFLVNEFEKTKVSSSSRASTGQWRTLVGPDRDFTVNYPIEPKRDEFRGKSSIGKAGPLIRRYSVLTDSLLLVLSFQDLDYPPNSPFADRVASTYEQKMKEAARKDGWKIVRIKRLSKSIAETEAWERSRTPDGYVHSISRTVVRNGQVYDLQCRSMFIDKELDRAICNRFINSFRIIGPPQ